MRLVVGLVATAVLVMHGLTGAHAGVGMVHDAAAHGAMISSAATPSLAHAHRLGMGRGIGATPQHVAVGTPMLTGSAPGARELVPSALRARDSSCPDTMCVATTAPSPSLPAPPTSPTTRVARDGTYDAGCHEDQPRAAPTPQSLGVCLT